MGRLMTDSSAPVTGYASPVTESVGSHEGVRLATVGDVADLASLLARAFADDPYFGYLVASGANRTKRMQAGWTAILRYASARLTATYTTHDRAGAAIWQPPHFAAPSRVEGLRLALATARMRGWRRTRAISDAVREIDSRRRFHVPDPHYYLEALGVDVGRQRKGIGSALVRPVLDRCDANGLAASLETANPRSLPLYERIGFRTVEKMTVRGAGLECWLMVRTPQPRA